MEINDKIVSKLSGPISFVLLEPIPDKFFNYKGMYPPVIMSFGDRHSSNEGTCTDTTYSIYNRPFLNLFDSLSTPEYPVDFYLESYFSDRDFEAIKNQDITRVKKLYHTDNTPLQNFRVYNQMCFFKNFKNATNCPAPNVRWHNVDIRFYESKNTFESLTQFVLNNQYLETLYTDKFNRLAKMIQMILSDKNNDTSTFITFYFDSEEFTTNSLVYKQIQKQCDSLKRVSIWKKWFTLYYNYIVSDTFNFTGNLTIFNEYITKLKRRDIDTKDFVANNMKVFEDIRVIVIEITSIFLDMYYITRLFKIPDGSTNPILSLNYFGNQHTKQIIYFLTDIMQLYNVSKDVNNENYYRFDVKIGELRCLDMPKFSLNKILDKYKKLRPTKSEYKLEDIFKYKEDNINEFLLSKEVDINLYTLKEKRYLLVWHLYNDNYISQKEISLYHDIEKIAYGLQNADTFLDFVNLTR